MLRNNDFITHPELIKTAPVEVRLALAKDKESSAGLLRVLAEDPFWFVRDYVASNESTPKDVLEHLRKDLDFRVRNEAEKALSFLRNPNENRIATPNVTGGGFHVPESLRNKLTNQAVMQDEAAAGKRAEIETAESENRDFRDSALQNNGTEDAAAAGADTVVKGVSTMGSFNRYPNEYARYVCGDLDRVVGWRAMQKERAEHPFSDTVDFAPIFDGKVYPTLGESVWAQIEMFGWQLEDDRRQSAPGGPGPMTPEKLRRILHSLNMDPYRPPNFYYAWRKSDDTLLMIGTASSQLNHIMVYEFDSRIKDYGARFYDISPQVNHMEHGVAYDPIEKLVSKVSGCPFLGSWRDFDRLMEDHSGLGKVLACGRWDLAKEKILGPEKGLDAAIAQATVLKQPEQASFIEIPQR